MIISVHDTVSMLQIHAVVFSCFVNAHHFLTVEKIVRKYNLNATLLHILMQHVNSLAVMTSIQNENITMKDADYSAAIIYFENLMKHLNAEETINIIKMTLLDSCFEEWCEKIENMILTQKCLGLLR